MLTLEALQDRFIAAQALAREATNNEVSALYRELATVYADLIGARMETGDETGHPHWSFNFGGGRSAGDNWEVSYSQQILHTPLGYFGTRRRRIELRNGASEVLVGSDVQMLKARVVAFLNKTTLSPETKESVVNAVF